MSKQYYPKKPQFKEPSKAKILARQKIDYVDIYALRSWRDRRPRAGELEAVYWLMIYHLGAKDALYSHVKRDGKIKNYDLGMRE